MIGLLLMNQKGYEVLNFIIENKLTKYITWIVSAIDNNVQKDFYEEIKGICNRNNLNLYNRSEKILPHTNYRIAIGWRWMIYDYENLIVLHDSLLPKYRGFAPLVSCLINGERKLGVTALYAGENFDTGEIIFQRSVEINYPILIQGAIDMVSKIYCEIVVNIINELKQNVKLKSVVQNDQIATYSIWRDFEDYFIDWDIDARKIRRFIDAVGYPYFGAKSYYNGNIITIIEAEEYLDFEIENPTPGKVLLFDEGFPVIICGTGTIKLKKIFDTECNEVKITSIRTRLK